MPSALPVCCVSGWRRSFSRSRSKASASRPRISSRSQSTPRACSGMSSAQPRTGHGSWSGSRCALATARCTAWRSIPTTARSLPGAGASPGDGSRANSRRPDRVRYGCSRRRGGSLKTSFSCARALSASKLDGGTAMRPSATTSSPSCKGFLLAGYTANRMNGTCMVSLPDYAELHCLSNFSFLRGASHPEELIERAAALGYQALALTDECSLAGVVRAHAAAKEHKLKLVIGTEVAVESEKLVLLATDRRSYGAISSLITAGRRRGKKGAYSLSRADLEPLAASGALVLWVPGVEAWPARWLAERCAGRAWIAAELHCGPNDRARLEWLR